MKLKRKEARLCNIESLEVKVNSYTNFYKNLNSIPIRFFFSLFLKRTI
jgi:hypothetical protein